eukprot:6172134-Pleurochrysis_carterae.AAC.2
MAPPATADSPCTSSRRAIAGWVGGIVTRARQKTRRRAGRHGRRTRRLGMRWRDMGGVNRGERPPQLLPGQSVWAARTV